MRIIKELEKKLSRLRPGDELGLYKTRILVLELQNHLLKKYIARHHPNRSLVEQQVKSIHENYISLSQFAKNEASYDPRDLELVTQALHQSIALLKELLH